MPGGARSYATATTLNGHIYVIGGWPNLKRVECYDPATDMWSEVAPMSVGRQGAGVAASGGYLYVAGGGSSWTGLRSAERYDPAVDAWVNLPDLNSGDRAGCGAVLCAGRIYVVGGSGDSITAGSESLGVGSSLSDSTLTVTPGTIRGGETLTYRILLRNRGADDISAGEVIDPIPAHTTYIPGSVTGGANYNSALNRIEWSGAVAAGASHDITFQVTVASGLPNGTNIVNTAIISDGLCQQYQRVARATIREPNLSASFKSVSQEIASWGDILTYTIWLLNQSPYTITSASMVDSLPAGITYVPESLSPDEAQYDSIQNRIEWFGIVPPSTTAQSGEWQDSDEGDVAYQWINATDGLALPKADDDFFGPLELGFTFPFWGQEYTQFYVNTNGMITFGAGSSSLSDTRIPSTSPPNNFVAAFWDDLNPAAGGQIYYKTEGTASNRRVIIEWHEVPHYGSTDGLTFEIVLYEDGRILIQYQTLLGAYADGSDASVGIENADGTEGIEYLGSGEGPGFPLHSGLAVLFRQPQAELAGEQRISFQVRVNDDLIPHSTIANTAIIEDGLGHRYEVTATTWLDGIDLSSSDKIVDKTFAKAGDRLTYRIRLRNTGLEDAERVTLVDPIPAFTTFVEGSLTGDAAYDSAQNCIVWSGIVPVEAEGGYSWTDSDVGDVVYSWIEASDGIVIPTADDVCRGPYDLGFTFTFYGQQYDRFYVNTNGQILFETESSTFANVEIPNSSAPNNYIALFWDDLNSSNGGSIYYKIYGEPGSQYAVIEFVDVPFYGSSERLTCEAILYEENGDILLQYQRASGTRADGSSATVGIENADGTEGIEYLYSGGGPGYPIHDNLAVLFSPATPGLTFTYQVEISPSILPHTIVTNTAVIGDRDLLFYERSAVTKVDYPDLSGSTAMISTTEVLAGGALSYTITLRNTGTGPADSAGFLAPVPHGMTYVPESATGGAYYDEVADCVRWEGSMEPDAEMPFSFALATDPSAPNGTVVTTTISVFDGLGNHYEYALLATLMRPDLSTSMKLVSDDVVVAGQVVTYTLHLHNTGAIRTNALVTDTLPSGLHYVDESVWASSGIASYADGVVTWQGGLVPRGMVLVRFAVRVDESIVDPTVIENRAVIGDDTGERHERSATIYVNAERIWLPLLFR